VVNPELICGVLTARNSGKESFALVDRWNSWGAYQWNLFIGTQSAGNPQHDWYANFYTETILIPGETRHAWFYVTRSRTAPRFREGAWWFLVGDAFGVISVASFGERIDISTRFVRGQSLSLAMGGSLPEAYDTDRAPTTTVWTGVTTVRSEELTSVQDLEARIQGQPLR
jgi:hypothetical protein